MPTNIIRGITVAEDHVIIGLETGPIRVDIVNPEASCLQNGLAVGCKLPKGVDRTSVIHVATTALHEHRRLVLQEKCDAAEIALIWCQWQPDNVGPCTSSWWSLEIAVDWPGIPQQRVSFWRGRRGGIAESPSILPEPFLARCRRMAAQHLPA